jgi:hypothetical protein
MEGAILSGQLAAKAVAESALAQQSDATFVPPQQLTERPRDSSAADANDSTPDMTMYNVRVATNVPPAVQEELEAVSTVQT